MDLYLDEENPAKKLVSFGTTLDRGCFPFKCEPDRTGNELYPLKGSPNRGPGLYNNAELTSFTYNLDKRICSVKGYTFSARTDPRFRKVHSLITPSPTEYQTEWTKPKTSPSAYKPFETAEVRFRGRKVDQMKTPGPGTYEHDIKRDRHVSWPKRFGPPITPIQPVSTKRTLKTELLGEKEFRKFRNRVAYFKLYFD